MTCACRLLIRDCFALGKQLLRNLVPNRLSDLLLLLGGRRLKVGCSLIVRSPLCTQRILLSSETFCLGRELPFLFSTSGSHQRGCE